MSELLEKTDSTIYIRFIYSIRRLVIVFAPQMVLLTHLLSFFFFLFFSYFNQFYLRINEMFTVQSSPTYDPVKTLAKYDVLTFSMEH